MFSFAVIVKHMIMMRTKIVTNMIIMNPPAYLPDASATQATTKTHEEDKPAEEKLRIRRSVFIQRVSDATLDLLLDELLLNNVINDAEMESVRGSVHKIRIDKARELVDLVRRKGNKACSQMFELLCPLDTHLSEQMCL